GGIPTELEARAHDAAAALVSHAPQLVSTLMAKRLAGATASQLALVGQGVRDVTRIAASDPELWVQIVGANALEVAPILAAFRDDLDAVLTALTDPDAPGSRRTIAEDLAAGNRGVAALPGKHGQ